MTADALNFRDLAFRQTSSLCPRPLHSLRSPASHLHGLAGVTASSYGGVRGPRAASLPCSVPGDPLARPLRSGQTLSWRFHSPDAAGPAWATAPPARCGSGNKLRAQRLEKLARAGRRPPRAPEFPAGRERPRTRLPAGKAAWSLGVPPPPAGPDPHTHMHAFAHARAHTCTHLHTRAYISAHRHSRARSRPHTLRVVTKEEGLALPYFSFSSPLFCSPPAPRRRARPHAPALCAPRPAAAAAGIPEQRVRAATSRPGARARSPAGWRQKLRRRRRPRGQGVLANCQETCVRAGSRSPEPGAGSRGAGARRGRGRGRGAEETHPLAQPLARARTARGLENKLSALFSLGCGRGRGRRRRAGSPPGSLHSPHSSGSPPFAGAKSPGPWLQTPEDSSRLPAPPLPRRPARPDP